MYGLVEGTIDVEVVIRPWIDFATDKRTQSISCGAVRADTKEHYGSLVPAQPSKTGLKRIRKLACGPCIRNVYPPCGIRSRMRLHTACPLPCCQAQPSPLHAFFHI